MSEYIELSNIDNILRNISQKIIQNEDIAKCLKFNTPDALSQTITDDERYELYNQDINNLENTRVIFRPFNNDVIEDQRSEIRIYYASFAPDNPYLVKARVGFDIIVCNELWRLDGGRQRPTTLFKGILQSLNGQLVDGVGELVFSDSTAVLRYFNSKFTGYSFTMKTRSV